ncbi:MAG: alpha/beta hydrolase [Acidobacteriota bacterium]
MNTVGLILAALAALYGAALLFIRLREDSFVFKPRRGAYGPLPDDLAPHIERPTIRTSDGLSLAAFSIAAERDAANAPWLIYLHGNGGHLAVRGRLERFRLWRAMGLNVLAIDYRGYGESEGTPSEAGALPRCARDLCLVARGEERVTRIESCCWAVRWVRPLRSIWPPSGAAGRLDSGRDATLPRVSAKTGFRCGRSNGSPRIDSTRSPRSAVYVAPHCSCTRDDRTIPIRHGRVFTAANQPKRVELDGTTTAIR